MVAEVARTEVNGIKQPLWWRMEPNGRNPGDRLTCELRGSYSRSSNSRLNCSLQGSIAARKCNALVQEHYTLDIDHNHNFAAASPSNPMMVNNISFNNIN